MNTLQQLGVKSQISAYSSCLDELEVFEGISGATVNPSLVLQAIRKENFVDLIYESCNLAKQSNQQDASELKLAQYACDALLALIAAELYRLLDIQVSLEVDVRLAKDASAMVARGERIAQLGADFSVPPDKLLIKIAATPAGIEALRQLQNVQINCNATMIFCSEQAIAAAHAGARLVSPQVGRISDYYHAYLPEHESDECPGVELVRNVQGCFRQFRYSTKVMGESFFNTSQILKLAGTDCLNISPKLLNKLQNLNTTPSSYNTNADYSNLSGEASNLAKLIGVNPMIRQLLYDGIKRSTTEQISLEKLLLIQLKA